MITAKQLRTEYLMNPIGIDFLCPKLSWSLITEDAEYEKRQTAYEIRIAKTIEELHKIDCCTTGKINSAKTVGICWPGNCLQSREHICWQVRVWDELGTVSVWSEPAFFEMGLLNHDDWKAQFINPEQREEEQPASYVRKRFSHTGAVKKARLYITACGLYEAWINGQKVGDQILTPGITSYNQRLQYQTYDVTNQIREGENWLGVILGNGWFRGMNGMYGETKVFGSNLLILAQLEIEDLNGNIYIIKTDESWEATQDGPIRKSDIQQGEDYNAMYSLGDWTSVKGERQWHPVSIGNYDKKVLVGTQSVPIMEHEVFYPEVLCTSNGEHVLDFHQNMAGYVEFSVDGPRNCVVTLQHGETLDENGNFTMANIEKGRPDGKPLLQKIRYTLNGSGRITYKPSFSYFGFRYVKLENWPEEIKAENFKAHAVYSSLEETGKFTCSNMDVNKLVENVVWSQKSNFVDIPTDCPQRERAGYTGDAQIFVKTGNYLMNSYPFFRKWLKEVCKTQMEDGKIINISPSVRDVGGFRDKVQGSAGWGDAIVIVPWKLYCQYGDDEILLENYTAMKAWVDYEIQMAKKTHWSRKLKYNPYRNYTWDTGFHWGEWLEPGQSSITMIKNTLFSVPETATAYLAYSSELLCRIAGILNYVEDAQYYFQVSENAKKSYVYNFTHHGTIHSRRQCRYVRPLQMNLIPEKYKMKAAQMLNKLVESNEYHLNTGFLSTPDLCKTLCDFGYEETAYRLLLQETAPGWLYSVKKGATTIWEKWTGIDEKNRVDGSLNHYAYGSIVGWLFETVAGIRPSENGYAKIIMKPTPGPGLDYVCAKYESVYGSIQSVWERNEKRMKYKFDVPVNVEVTIFIPCTDKKEVKPIAGNPRLIERKEKEWIYQAGSGRYQFDVE